MNEGRLSMREPIEAEIETEESATYRDHETCDISEELLNTFAALRVMSHINHRIL